MYVKLGPTKTIKVKDTKYLQINQSAIPRCITDPEKEGKKLAISCPLKLSSKNTAN